jgi:hypothetical protein
MCKFKDGYFVGCNKPTDDVDEYFRILLAKRLANQF